MKVLVIGNISDIYTREFISEILRKEYSDISVLSHTPASVDDKKFAEEHSVKVFVKEPKESKRTVMGVHIATIASSIVSLRMCRHYDKIFVLEVGVISFSIPLFIKRSSSLVLCYYGSDLLRISPNRASLLKGVVKRANHIVLENENMKKAFIILYGKRLSEKVVLAHYGSLNAEFMEQYFQTHAKQDDKDLFSIPKNRICLFVGYNGGRGQRHIEILERLQKMTNEVRSKLYVVIHCAYGASSDYLAELEECLRNCGIEGRLIPDYMSGDRLAAFRHCADVMLNLQITDCMSASMIECMEAGAIVVKGDWLEYPDIIKHDGYLISIKDMDDLPILISGIVDDYNKYSNDCFKNKGILKILKWNLLEWEPVL